MNSIFFTSHRSLSCLKLKKKDLLYQIKITCDLLDTLIKELELCLTDLGEDAVQGEDSQEKENVSPVLGEEEQNTQGYH